MSDFSVRRQGFAPGLGLCMGCLSGFCGLRGQDVEVAVLAGFGERVGGIAAAYVGGHAQQEVGDGDFIVGEFGRLGRIAVPPLFAGLDALQVVAFEIAFGAGAVAGESDFDGREVVLQVDGLIVDDFAALAAHEQALAADPRKVLFAGEVENAEAVAEIEGGNELVGVDQFLGLGGTLSGGALHDWRGEAAGGDGGGLAADAEEAADEADAVVAVGRPKVGPG